MLEKQSGLLVKQGEQLEHHGQLLEHQDQLLNKQGQILEKHGQILEKHGQLLEKQGLLIENLVARQAGFAESQVETNSRLGVLEYKFDRMFDLIKDKVLPRLDRGDNK